jgi:adenine-specific DNA-methyltransferase
MSLKMIREPYSSDLFLKFIDEFLPDFSEDQRPVQANGFSHIKSARKLGHSESLELAVYEVEHSGGNDKKVGLALEGFRILKDTAVYNALVVFKSADTDTWRLSLMTTTQELKNGKVVNAFSNPKRYSYILGEGAKTATPQKFLIAQKTVKDFADLVSRFSVEVVNNEFYAQIAGFYDALVGSKDAVLTDRLNVIISGLTKTEFLNKDSDGKHYSIEPLIKYPSSTEESHQFAVRLIGRTVFCWFLREKTSKSGLPLISKEILSRSASSADNYYHTTLAPLFFQVLNEPMNKRTSRFKSGDFGKIPYLNGGLFADQDGDYYKFDDITEQSVPGLIGIPDEWIRKFFDLLELYHFTVDENTSVDIDLSIDPEMLGRIFENLLARINPETGETVRKATGSFYTPREVVEYMVDHALVEYLSNSTNIEKDRLKALVSYSLEDDREFPLDDNQKRKTVGALNSIKILDPACGSGAYPIGVLQKVVFILQQIDPEAKIWFENQIANTIPEVRHLIEREFQHKNFDYIRKLGIIRESIFGIDIQPIATEIARLRCFLTLIVDERVDDDEPNRGVYPLPNLDFKFVTANTLIKLGTISTGSTDQTGLFEDQSGIIELKRLRDDYFNSHNSEKDSLKLKFSQTQKKMLLKIINSSSKGLAETTQKLSAWDPFTNDSTDWFDMEWMFGLNEGFDVVIGNPPYYIENDDRTRFEGLRSLECYQGKMNVWYLFGGFGIDSLKNNGILCYIATNNWTTNAGASKWRSKVMAEAKIISLLDFGSYMVFESASQQTMVMLFVKNKDDNYQFDYRRITANKPVKKDFQDLLNLSTNESNEYLQPSVIRSNFKDKLITFSDETSNLVLHNIANSASTHLFSGEVAQGIVFPQDYLNKKTAKALGSQHVINEGVFVLNNQEKDNLNLSNDELDVLKPYYTTKQLGRYSSSPTNDEWVIYTDSKFKSPTSMDVYPTLKGHLDRYSDIISSANQPYGLHRARDERFFKGDKIISLRKSPNRPAFTYVNFDCYVSATFYVIKTERLNTKYLTGLLNSKLVAFWLKNKGKMQGQNFQIDKDPLLTIPIAIPNASIQEKVADVVNTIYASGDNKSLEAQIDELIYMIYGLDTKDISIIEAAVI